MIGLDFPPSLEQQLRSLADRAAPATVASQDLAALVLRRARLRRRRRRTMFGAVAGVALIASSAAVSLGGGPYFDVTQPSGAMKPTIGIGESVTFNRDLTPQTGDVVYVELSIDGRTLKVISRVIGEPGDSVGCPPSPDRACEGVEVNGQRLDNLYLDALATGSFTATQVPDAHVFLLGDDRSLANDSRFIGPVPLSAIEGVAVAIEGRDGEQYALQGSPHHRAPDGEYLIDPPQRVPPASAR